MGSTVLSFALIFILLIAAGSLILGTWLLFRWRRGRRAGTHPTCRACGFDLRGLDLRGRILAAESTSPATPPPVPPMCPECGTTLVGKAIALGDPRRSPFTLIVALLCLLLALGIFGLALRRIWPTLTTRLPTPILAVQSRFDVNDNIGTITELASRMGGKNMSAGHATTLINRALDQQKNALVWNPAWGLIVENAHNAGLTSDEQWKQYLKVAATPFVDVSSKVAQGDPLTIDAGLRNCRVSARGSSSARVAMSVTAQISGVELIQATQGGGNFGLMHNGAAWSTYTAETASAEPGEQTLTIKVSAAVRAPEDDYAKSPRFTTEYVITRPISVSPRGTATHHMTTDPTLAESMRKALDVSTLDLEDSFAAGAVRTNFMVNISGIPRGIGMEMFLRVPNSEGMYTERSIGKVAIEAQRPEGSHGFGAGADIKDPQPFIEALRANGGVADLVFRPSIDVARTRPNLYEIWGAEIVLPSQKVKMNLKSDSTPTSNPGSGPNSKPTPSDSHNTPEAKK